MHRKPYQECTLSVSADMYLFSVGAEVDKTLILVANKNECILLEENKVVVLAEYIYEEILELNFKVNIPKENFKVASTHQVAANSQKNL